MLYHQHFNSLSLKHQYTNFNFTYFLFQGAGIGSLSDVDDLATTFAKVSFLEFHGCAGIAVYIFLFRTWWVVNLFHSKVLYILAIKTFKIEMLFTRSLLLCHSCRMSDIHDDAQRVKVASLLLSLCCHSVILLAF